MNSFARSRLAIVQTEEKFAISLRGVRTGDEIYRVQGVARALALRKVGSRYRLISFMDYPTSEKTIRGDILKQFTRLIPGEPEAPPWREIEII
jgi:hypothetical protein